MGVHKKEQKQINLEKQKERDAEREYKKFWGNIDCALPVLEKAYPNIPRPILEINFKLYNKISNMKPEERAYWETYIHNMPDKPNLFDFSGDVEIEDSGKVIAGNADLLDKDYYEVHGNVVGNASIDAETAFVNSTENNEVN